MNRSQPNPTVSTHSGGLVLAIGLLVPSLASSQVSTGQAPPPRSSHFAAEFAERPGKKEFSGRMIVKPVPDDGVSTSAREANERALQALAEYAVVGHQPGPGYYVIQVPVGEDENSVARKLEVLDAFVYVEPDWILFPLGCPDDDSFEDPTMGQYWHHQVMDSCLAWDLHTGKETTVISVIDTGIDVAHEDLLLNRHEGYNAATQTWEGSGGDISPKPLISTPAAHGTFVTGCLAANGNNDTGTVGVGWDLGHRMIRCLTLETQVVPNVWRAYESTILDGAVVAAQQGDRVVSVSWSGVDSQAVRDTATYLRQQNVLLVWGAGNDPADYLAWNSNPDLDDLIVVGATDVNDDSWPSSATGPCIDLVAPGADVYSTWTGSGYAFDSGTSIATPLVAGLCGLLASYDPSLTAAEIEALIKEGAEDLGLPGIDDTFGHGRINLYESLKLAADELGTESCWTTPNSVGPGATMVAYGSTVVSDNELVLSASGLPPGKAAKFLIGDELVSVPTGEGIRCAGGNLVTLHPNLYADEEGRVQRVVDLTAPPASTVIAPGETVVVQLWYRDPAGGPVGVNMSNALEITWQ